MAKAPSRPWHVRLRQIPGDRRLHITDSGHTSSGSLAQVRYEISSSDIPYVTLELEDSEYDLFGDAVDSSTIEICVNRIVAADVAALDYSLLRDLPGRQLEEILGGMQEWFIPVVPPCGHEDVIEVTTLGDVQAQGMCQWCGHRMVADQQVEVTYGPWKPAEG